ncbi:MULTISPECIES: methyl-accepting chemotaxis protein [Pseudomonas]|uniref:Methyl-accepting chemotaxis protein n=2 Tax=Pseudomonas nitroreducens TaxID=46680 RepID=A0A6G6IPG5_PSENT|nr:MULTISPECIES: methyl-accepting chemotaxis protein [Pseudomonas]MBG6289940.1 methyl-accepting chemotaxis protein [Pseudomonas nitroreducens]MDG9852424.1 methyl-accepting chemotaxis protein [Pseudomonas nitroreducens]MDH1071527.1 methyl-accepting chemotaxis protein [Pseudomonas nitroreducens]NMZ59902.1 methyl-accepting chemotaxis protein [Pseudomonas nitroreducens]NMZ76070.1 methyl-accepting chemotaxis protein [Pseudomonas nitroreducens]
MGLFNAHAVAQQRADRITAILHSLVDGNLDVAIGEAPAAGYERLYDGLRNVQRSLREQRTELAQAEALEAGLVEMTRQHELGWIDEVIPVDKFAGRPARIAKGINDLVAAHIAVKMKVVATVTAYGKGDYSVEMDRLPGKKAIITEAIDGVRDSLKANADAAEYNARIKSALDNVSANVMIANNDLDIIYMNRTVTEMLGNAEADIRKQLPNFNASRLMGANIDMFHKNPAHQRGMLAHLTARHKAELSLGGRRFALDVVPVFNDAGERLGSAVQWTDRTEEFRAEQEVSQLVDAAVAGDFSKRIEASNKEGFFLKIATGLNSLVDTADKGLRDVTRVLGALAQGDLTQRIDADYQGTFGELKDYANETAQSLSRMLGQIREAADTIHTAASEIASGNAELSTRTEQQASSLEETASSMEELTSTVKLNAENARQANSLAVNASEVATEGGSVVQKVVGTMSAINDSARKIADIIGVIDGIAFQTNILALNAAVEAARAGEQGRGFAVVAGEVRTLAQRSAAAAKEIKTLINDSVDKVESGNTLVAQAGQTMSDIVVAIKRVTDIMAEIAAASAEQSSGIEEVNGAVSQMDEMTQQNAALVEEAAASAEALQEQAGMLNQQVGVFKLESIAATVVPLASARPARAEPVAHASRAARGVAKAVRAKGKEDDWEEF